MVMDTRDAASIAVLGAGSWGTALGILLAGNGRRVVLWARDPGHVETMASARRNPRYLPDVPFPADLSVEHELSSVLAEASLLILAVPCAGFRTTLQAALPHLRPDARIAWASKGLEAGCGKLLHEVCAEVLGEDRACAVISGPTFAHEVARGLPTAVTVASPLAAFAAELAAYLHNANFRVYTSDDMTGVEMGGALKNVLAIAAGIADGLGFGANTRAALVTRGLAEMMRLGVAMGGRRETFMGLAGLGDLVLTCTDDQSRNRRLGLALARGYTLEEASASLKHVVEGAHTAREALALAQARGVEMPITQEVCQVLYHARTPRDAVLALLRREQKAELL